MIAGSPTSLKLCIFSSLLNVCSARHQPRCCWSVTFFLHGNNLFAAVRQQMPWNIDDAEDLEQAWLLLADLYITAGKYDMATELLKRCLEHNKVCVWSLNFICYFLGGECCAVSAWSAVWWVFVLNRCSTPFWILYPHFSAKTCDLFFFVTLQKAVSIWVNGFHWPFWHYTQCIYFIKMLFIICIIRTMTSNGIPVCSQCLITC